VHKEPHVIPATQRKIRGAVQRRAPLEQPTKEKLLQTALNLLETHFPENITGEMLLEKSRVSRGSLYHHFLDVSDLLEQALVRKFSAQVDANIEALSNMMAMSKSAAEMYDALCVITDITQAPENKRSRFVRARLIGFAEDNDRLLQRLGAEQKRLTDALTGLFTTAQERGWMNKSFEPKTAALFVQAYTLGHVIDDISIDHIDQDSWNELIKRVIKQVFC
jgi:AcrR family transcriptional regulator